MIRLCRGVYIHGAVFPVFVIAAFSGMLLPVTLAFLSALAHELSHLLAALFLSERCLAVALMPYGLRLTVVPPKKPSHEFLLAAAGPFFNALMCVLFPEGVLFEINLAMLILNLFPILPLDGGRMLFCSLCSAVGSIRAYGVLRRLSVLLGTVLLLLGALQAILTGFNLSVLLAGTFLLADALSGSSTVRLTADHLTGSRKKLRSGIRRGQTLVARGSESARSLLSELSPGRYAMIDLIGEDGKPFCRISEEQLTDAILLLGARVNLYEIAKNS